MWTRILGYIGKGTTLLGSKNVIFAAVAAIGLVFAGGYVRINYLNNKVASLEDDIAVLSDTVDVYYSANQINYANVKDLSKKLEMCQMDNMAIAAKGRDQVKAYNNILEGMKRTMSDEMLRVRQILQNQTCATVAIPSDIDRMLRARTVDQNGTSD